MRCDRSSGVLGSPISWESSSAGSRRDETPHQMCEEYYLSESQLWLMLVNSVSGENKTARMRIWRALKASGAAALRDGVYLLPKSESARAVFAEQAQEVVAAGGMAHIVAYR